SVADNINPIIIYENRIMFSSYLKVILQREIKEHLENQAGTPYFIYSENNEFSTITISHMGSFKKMWLPLLTKLLENKIVHCLIVGREFLTHRWDGICFNTFLNISAAESTLFSTRLLARILEPGFDIVAAKHLWDFCCIMPETEYGMSDYARIATRKAYGWHLCEDGEFEQGINYFHPFLRKGMSNIPQSLMQEVNDTATRLITHRDNILEMWSTKHSRDNHGRDVLEISMPRSIDLQKPLVVERESEEKLTHNTISLFNLIHDMCSVVIKCIVKSSPLEKSPELILNERHKGVFRLEIKHDSQEVRDSTLKAISELLAPIHHQHHIVSLYFGDEGHHGFFSKFFSQTHLDYCTPFAVPECFFKKNDLAIFLYYWRHDVSKGELLAHRNPRIREDIHHMLNTQQRLIRPNCQTCSLLV
ncbi:MAG: hypothetical protein HRT88_10565, partial [Lentisphaeraceae bacterium]|nr:hypothetical protein [Lentisphaeraceae bacterium]